LIPNIVKIVGVKSDIFQIHVICHEKTLKCVNLYYQTTTKTVIYHLERQNANYNDIVMKNRFLNGPHLKSTIFAIFLNFIFRNLYNFYYYHQQSRTSWLAMTMEGR